MKRIVILFLFFIIVITAGNCAPRIRVRNATGSDMNMGINIIINGHYYSNDSMLINDRAEFSGVLKNGKTTKYQRCATGTLCIEYDFKNTSLYITPTDAFSNTFELEKRKRYTYTKTSNDLKNTVQQPVFLTEDSTSGLPTE